MRHKRKPFLFILEVLKYVWKVACPAHTEIWLLPFIQDIISSPWHVINHTTPSLSAWQGEHSCTLVPLFSDPFGLSTRSQIWVESLTLPARRDTGLRACSLHSHWYTGKVYLDPSQAKPVPGGELTISLSLRRVLGRWHGEDIHSTYWQGVCYSM